MRLCKFLWILSVVILISSCNNSTKTRVETTLAQHHSAQNPGRDSLLKVSAYLVYNDGTVSEFDVLNDKSIALWNTIIGAGDAEKPSERVRIRLTGPLDNIQLEVFNGGKKAGTHKLHHHEGSFETTVEDTGCQPVRVLVRRNGIKAYEGEIDFRCGE
jgi:hypothetical protein